MEPHVRIDDATGNRKREDGGLLYTENLSPQTFFASLLIASKSRRKGHEMQATGVLKNALSFIDGKLVQIGDDATTGRI